MLGLLLTCISLSKFNREKERRRRQKQEKDREIVNSEPDDGLQSHGWDDPWSLPFGFLNSDDDFH